MSGPPDTDDAIFDDDFEDDDLDDAEMSCGLMPDGHCQLVGTEWCDWDCPFADEAAHNRRRPR